MNMKFAPEAILNRPRKVKILMYVMGSMQELVEMGLLEELPKGLELSNTGLAAFRTLKDAGFSPTEEEIVDATHFLMSEESRL